MISRTYPPQFWTHPETEIRPSPIVGKGVFARRDFDAGEVIEIVGGVVMTDSEFEAFCATVARFNAIQIDENRHLVERVDVTQQRDGSINHACDSNLWMADENTVITRRSIAAGEELTVDYALFTASPGWQMSPCLCRSPHCRHVVTGSDWMKRDVQARYRGHFSPFLNRRIESLGPEEVG